MAAKDLIFDAEARRQLKSGIDALANAVKVTLGPRGRNVAIDKKWGAPTVTHDGVTVAKEIELENHFANMGAQMLKQAATKTNDVAGDGTTTSTVIAQSIVTEGLRNLAAGANPMLMKRGIDAATVAVVEEIKKGATPLKGHDDIEHIATISANDPEIGRLLAEAMDKVGRDGVITVEEGKGLKLEVEYTEGMQFDRGYISPYFITDSGRMEAAIDEPYLLITDKKISAITDIVPVLEKLVQTGKKELVIIAEDVDKKLDQTTLNDLGQARRVVATKDDTTIVEGRGEQTEIQGRINQIKVQIDETTSDYDREKLQERLAKLSGGVAVIKVGAATEVELKEKKARVEDALHATRAAVEEGIIPGGGVTLLRAQKALDDFKLEDEDEQIGVTIVRRALEEPLRQIAQNAGHEGSVVVEKVRANNNAAFGFNAATEEYCDLVREGVIDPAKVARTALQNATSIASLLLTTEAVVAELPEKKEKKAGAGIPGTDM